jgi:hypothetical protein
MKKRLIITSVIVAFLFLVGHSIYNRVGNALNERERYVTLLDLHFSATVDSIKTFWPGNNGYVYFHPSNDSLDLSTEDRAGQKLKFNGSLRFILEEDSALAFHARDIGKYQSNDSLVINSDVGKIFIYRQGKLTAESEIWKALNGI